MWKSALIFLLVLNCNASNKALLASANNLFINKITSKDLIEVSKNAKKELVNNKSDKDEHKPRGLLLVKCVSTKTAQETFEKLKELLKILHPIQLNMNNIRQPFAHTSLILKENPVSLKSSLVIGSVD